jgi:integrase
MSKKDRKLTKVLRCYDRDNELSPLYVGTLGCSVRRFERYLGRPPRESDLKSKTVNKWMRYEQAETSLSDRSRANGLSHIITLWKYTGRKFDRRKIRHIKVRPKNPAAWDHNELREVADAMQRLPGKLPNGVPRSLYFSTILWFAYETGLRRRDIWDFDLSWLVGNQATLSQHKTGQVHIIQVSDETLSDMRKISEMVAESDSAAALTPLRWPQGESQFYYWFRRAREIAGIDAKVVNRALQHMRRTGATAVCKSGESAFRYLGHTKEGLDRLSYVDQIKTAKAVTPTIARDPSASLRVAT